MKPRIIPRASILPHDAERVVPVSAGWVGGSGRVRLGRVGSGWGRVDRRLLATVNASTASADPTVGSASRSRSRSTVDAGGGGVSGVPPGPLQVRMSRTSPGRYALHEFSRNVYDVVVTDGARARLTTSAAEPAPVGRRRPRRDVRMRYRVFGDRTDGTYLEIDATPRAHQHAGGADVGAGTGSAADAADIRTSRRHGVERRDAVVPDRRSARVPGAQPAVLMDSPAEFGPGVLETLPRRWPAGDSRPARRSRRTPPRRHRGRRRTLSTASADRRTGTADVRRIPGLRERRLHVPYGLPAMGQRRRHGAPQQHGARRPRRAGRLASTCWAR